MDIKERERYKLRFRTEMEPFVLEKVEAMRDAARLARKVVDPITLMDMVLVSLILVTRDEGMEHFAEEELEIHRETLREIIGDMKQKVMH